MGPDETICRICLQIIEEELPHSVLRSNEALMEDLNLICPLIFNNLDLTEEPSICDLCETTIRELATFQKSIVTIEAELQEKQDSEANFVPKNPETTCRLCLQTVDDLATSWKDCEGLLLQCNLLMMLNVEAPNKICECCVGTLENLNDFLQRASKFETVIVVRAKKLGKLSSQDLFSISSKDNKIDGPLQVTITETPNTYQKKRPKCNLPSTSGIVQNCPKVEEKFASIDASPATIADITLGHLEDEPNEEISTVEYEIDEANNSSSEEEEIVPQIMTRKRKADSKKGAKMKKMAKEEKVAGKANKPVEVVIIKSTKKSKKAELDKTWQELTGKPNKETFVEEVQGGVEVQLVSSKRGRPKKPETTHQKKDSKKSTVWSYCDLCSFKTYSQNSLVAHQLIHNLRGPDAPNFQCDLCSFKTPSAEVMRAHKSNHPLANITYKCIFCDEMFKKKVACMYHTLKHDDQDIASQFYCMVYNWDNQEEFYECYQCSHQNVDESSMPDHVISHTVENVKTCLVTTYKCDQCQYITKDQDLLERHKTMHNDKKKGKKQPVKDEPVNEEVIYKCDKCPYMSKNKRSLSNHKGLKHNRVLPPMGPPSAKTKKERPMYFCNECSYSTHRKVNLPRHQLVHRTKKNMEFYECSNCIFETKHRRSYTRHLESVHGLIS